jgi:hypothetical protein
MNQYRCEICKLWDYHCPLYGGKIKSLENVIEAMAIVGCASHSDFQSERDKVLDELERLYQLYNNDDKCRDDNTPQKYISQGSASAYKQAIEIIRNSKRACD